MKKNLILFTTLVLIFTNLQAQNWSLTSKLVANDRAENESFGYSVATSEEWTVVGAPMADVSDERSFMQTDAGAAYIFHLVDGEWQQVQKIIAPDASASNNFGYSIAISGDYIVVGALQNSTDENYENTVARAGAAYIYENQEGTWSFQQKIVGSDRNASDWFGRSVGVSGDYIVVGADGNPFTPAAYVYHRTNEGWTFNQKLLASPNSSYSEFGISVSIAGNSIVVGAKSNSTDQDNLNTLNYAGAAYIFENTEGVWSQTQKIVAFDRATYDAFGQSVSITDGYLVVGSGSYNDELGENPSDFIWGGAYLYEYSNGNWDFVQKITTQNKERYSRTALSVSIDNQNLILSAEESDEIEGLAEGGAYIFENVNGIWEAKKSILFSELSNNDLSFTPVSIFGNNAVIGAPAEDTDVLGENFLSAAGSIYFLNKSTNTGFNHLISESLNVYPNPSDGHLTIEGNFGVVESLQVSDISGRLVFEQSNPIFSNYVDISNLEKGIYFIEIQSNKQSFSAEIVLK